MNQIVIKPVQKLQTPAPRQCRGVAGVNLEGQVGMCMRLHHALVFAVKRIMR